MTIPLFSSSVIGSIPQTATIEAFGWALVHFVWQGAAIALALGAFLVFARRLSPQVRYVAGCAALSLMALGACSTFAWHIARAAGQSTPEITVAASIDSPRPTPRVEALVADRLLEQNASPVPDSVALPLRTGAGEKGAQDHETAGESISSPIDLSTPRTTLSAGWTNRLRACLPWVVAFWGAGVGLLSLRLAHGWQTIRRLRDTGVEFADPVWSERIARLQKRLGISRSVRFLSSAGAAVPMVIGALKPVILLPVGMLAGLSALQVEALLVHELAHIRRHDYIVNLIQNLLETLCFYHPAVWWVSGQIRKEREHCCDDVASAACGALDYAQALASLAELRQASPSFGLAANGTPLVDRIRRLAGVDPSSQSTAGWLAVLALVALVTAIALRPADRTHADGQDTKTVKGTVLLAQGRPLADADVVGESHQHRYGPARTNGQGRFELQVPTGIVIESYRVSLPHSFVVSVTLDKRAPLALCLQRWAASAKVEKQEPLVLKVVETHYPWGGYWPPSKKKSSPQTNASGKSVRRIAGKVVDHDGKPLADAHVWWIVFDHGVRRPTVLAECACDRAGRFRMEISSDGKPPATRPNDELWALAPGKKSNALGETEKLQVTEGPATSNVSSEVVIHLDPAPDFSFLVNNAGGRPVGGASLERLWCGQYFPGALLGEFLADPEWPAPFRDRDRVTTDASGVAHLSAHSDEIRITARECGIQTIHLPHVQPPVFPIGGKERYVVKRRSINLRPVGRVEGQVIADDLRSVRGIKLRISTSWEQSETFVEGSAIVMTDDAGQFVIPAIAAGKLRFKLLDAPANPSLIPVARHIDVRAQETTHLEIRMERPVLIDGMIRAERTGEPIAGAEIYLGGGLQQGEKLTSNAQGQYHARFPAGQILLKEISLPDERHADYQQWFSGVRPGRTVPSSMHSPPMWKVALSATVDGKPRDLPAIVRIPTKMLEGLAIDAAGRPLVKAFVKAENGLGRYVATTDGHGEFEMQVPKASKFKSYYVWLPDRLGTDVKIQKQEPLALKVDAISATGGDEFSPRKKDDVDPQKSPIPPAKSKPSEPVPRAPGSSQAVRKITGSVVDHDGKPVAAARLWWLVPDDDAERRFRTIAESESDLAGRFRIQASFNGAPSLSKIGQLWVLAPGKNWTVHDAPRAVADPTANEKATDLVIRLDAASDIEFQVNDSEGRPVPRAVIEPSLGYFRASRRAACGVDTLPTEPAIPTAVRDLGRTTTDAAGKAHLIGWRNVAHIKVTAPTFGTQMIRMPATEEQFLKRIVTLLPTGRVEGQLIAADPRLVRGIKLWIRTSELPEDSFYAHSPRTEGTEMVVTDAAGRFVIPAIAEGTLAFKFVDQPGRPTFLPKMPQEWTVKQGDTTHAEIRLEPAVLVEGVVQTKDTRQPIAGIRVSLQPDGVDHSIDVISDAQGRYQARVLPGLYWMSSTLPDSMRAHFADGMSPFSLVPPWRVLVQPTTNGEPFQVPVTVFIALGTVKGTVIDSDGHPVVGATVIGESRRHRYFGSTHAGGAFELRVPEPIKLASYDVSLSGRLVTDVSIEKQEPLVVKIKSISATEGYEFSRKKHPLEVQWASEQATVPPRR